MKNNNFVVMVIAFAILIAGAALAYNVLTEDAIPEKPNVETNKTEKREKAPNFIAYNDENKMVKLSSLKGKPVVVNFWATWCGPCKVELPAFDSQHEKYKEQVEFLMVNMTDGQRETVDVAKAFVEENGYSFPVVYDTEFSAAEAYSVSSIPLTVFVDEDGYIVNSHMGTMNETTLNKYITELIGG